MVIKIIILITTTILLLLLLLLLLIVTITITTLTTILLLLLLLLSISKTQAAVYCDGVKVETWRSLVAGDSVTLSVDTHLVSGGSGSYCCSYCSCSRQLLLLLMNL
jgi:hypothetical protein